MVTLFFLFFISVLFLRFFFLSSLFCLSPTDPLVEDMGERGVDDQREERGQSPQTLARAGGRYMESGKRRAQGRETPLSSRKSGREEQGWGAPPFSLSSLDQD